MKSIKIVVSIIFVLVLAGCGRAQPILNVENNPVAYDLQKKEVKSAIIEAATNRGWVVKASDGSEITFEVNVRSHWASIRVPYSEKFYSILYLSSENLKSDGQGNIHRNYNRWINNLNTDIQKKMSVLSASK